MITIPKQNGDREDKYDIIIFFNMDSFSQLPVASPDSRFKKKNSLPDEVWGYFYLYFICILCNQNVNTNRSTSVFQKVICDPHMFSFLMKTYADLGADKRRLALGTIFGIWVLGIIAWSIYYSITVGGLLIKLRRTCYKGDGRVERILEEIAPNNGISIRYTNLVDTPFLVGIFKPTIYMTEVECTDTQIKYILTHEYTHWKRKDPWKLLFAYLMIIIFWWNPLFRLLHKDIKLMIEMGCDKTMLRDYPMRYALEYLKTICYVLEAEKHSLKKLNFNSLNFVDINSEEGFKQRLFYVLDAKENLKLQKKINMAVICGCLVWMLSSYYFILQPTYSPDEEIQKLENQEDQVFNAKDTYLEKKSDGTYIFHVGGIEEKVSEQDVEKGLYDKYLIIKE